MNNITLNKKCETRLDPVAYFPTEVSYNFLSRLRRPDLVKCCLVSKRWRQLSNDPRLWRLPIPVIAVDAEHWNAVVGKTDKEPPLPRNFYHILFRPCPFWPDKKIHETHECLYIPSLINQLQANINNFRAVLSKRNSARSIELIPKYDDFFKEFGDEIIKEGSHWILMPKTLIPKSNNKTFEEMQELIALAKQKSSLPYEMPDLIRTFIFLLFNYSFKQNGLSISEDEIPYTLTKHWSYRMGNPIIGRKNNTISVDLFSKPRSNVGVAPFFIIPDYETKEFDLNSRISPVIDNPLSQQLKRVESIVAWVLRASNVKSKYTTADLEALVINFNQLFRECLGAYRLFSSRRYPISTNQIQELYLTVLRDQSQLNIIERNVYEAHNNRFCYHPQITAQSPLFSRYLTSIAKAAFQWISEIYRSTYQKQNELEMVSEEIKTPINSIHFKRIRDYYKDISVHLGILQISKEMVEFLRDVFNYHNEHTIEVETHTYRDTKHLEPPFLSAFFRSDYENIWVPISHPLDIISNPVLYKNYVNAPNSDRLKNFKAQLSANGSLAFTCGVIDTQFKAQEFLSTLKKLWALDQRKQPLRLIFHQLNSIAFNEETMIKKQNKWTRKIEDELKTEHLGPVVAHLNNSLNYTSRFSCEDTQSHLLNLEGLATLVIWGIEDILDITLKNEQQMTRLNKLINWTSQIQGLRWAIIDQKNILDTPGGEDVIQQEKLSKLQAVLKTILKDIAKEAFYLGSELVVDHVNQQDKILKAQNILQVIAYVLALQTDCLTDLNLKPISRTTEMELHFLLDMLLGGVTSINCKSGLDRTGFMRSCRDAMKLMHRIFLQDLAQYPLEVREQLAYQDLLLMILEMDTKIAEHDQLIHRHGREKNIPYVADLLGSFGKVDSERNAEFVQAIEWSEEAKPYSRTLLYQTQVMKNMLSVASVISLESRKTIGLKYGQNGGWVDSFFANPHPLSRLPMFVQYDGKNMIKIIRGTSGRDDLTEAGKQILLGFTQYVHD